MHPRYKRKIPADTGLLPPGDDCHFLGARGPVPGPGGLRPHLAGVRVARGTHGTSPPRRPSTASAARWGSRCRGRRRCLAGRGEQLGTLRGDWAGPGRSHPQAPRGRFRVGKQLRVPFVPERGAGRPRDAELQGLVPAGVCSRPGSRPGGEHPGPDARKSHAPEGTLYMLLYYKTTRAYVSNSSSGNYI